jgi:hypothetical protein
MLFCFVIWIVMVSEYLLLLEVKLLFSVCLLVVCGVQHYQLYNLRNLLNHQRYVKGGIPCVGYTIFTLKSYWLVLCF